MEDFMIGQDKPFHFSISYIIGSFQRYGHPILYCHDSLSSPKSTLSTRHKILGRNMARRQSCRPFS